MLTQTVTIIATGETFTGETVKEISKFLREKTGQEEPRTEYVEDGNKLFIFLDAETDIPFASVSTNYFSPLTVWHN
jgi:hypothetical protein